MKKLFFVIAAVIFGGTAFSQMQNPVSWSFTSKKISDNVYEVQMAATLQSGWHLYSQTQPKDA
ncbi:MAG: hypothetical protein M3Y85_00600, partial [Bacteroidota bacterium]|nr:hypothetical protein [Bacteroidota bacterium]